MNEGITKISHKYTNILLMENYYDIFACETETLYPSLGRFYRGAPNERDDVHLGNAGIRLLARCIKHCVLKRKGSVLSFGQRPTQGEARGRTDDRSGHHNFNGQYRTALVFGRSQGGHNNHD